MGTWYYPSQVCFDIELSIARENDFSKYIYSYENNKKIYKIINNDTNLKALIDLYNITEPSKNHIIFLTCCRVTESFNFDLYTELFNLDYINRISNYSIEYYISNCSSNYKSFHSNNNNKVEIIKYLQASNRKLIPKTKSTPELVGNMSLETINYFENQVHIDNYIKYKFKINPNISTYNPYLYYFNQKLNDISNSTKKLKLSNKTTFDHSVFPSISLTKQIKFIEKILDDESDESIDYDV